MADTNRFEYGGDSYEFPSSMSPDEALSVIRRQRGEEAPEMSRTEVPSEYSGEKPSWISQLLGAVGAGVARGLPGSTTLRETEPRVLFEEKKDFMPLLGRIPGVGKYLVPSGRQDVPALVYAPPGTEERARYLYPTANLVTAGTPEESAKIAEQVRKEDVAAEQMPAAAGLAEMLTKMVESGGVAGALPKTLPAWALGAAGSTPYAVEALSTGHPYAAAGEVAGGALTAGLLDKMMNFKQSYDLPDEAQSLWSKIRTGKNLTPHEGRMANTFGRMLHVGEVEAQRLNRNLNQTEWNTIIKRFGFTPSKYQRMLEWFERGPSKKSLALPVRMGLGATTGALMAPEGKKGERALMGGLLASMGKTPAHGIEAGILPWVLMKMLERQGGGGGEQ